jgi:hypothetical protein
VPFTWQALQRTFITIATNLDVPAYTLKRLLGHGTGDDTAGYIVGDVETLRDPVQRIADGILGLARCCPQNRLDIKATAIGRVRASGDTVETRPALRRAANQY